MPSALDERVLLALLAQVSSALVHAQDPLLNADQLARDAHQQTIENTGEIQRGPGMHHHQSIVVMVE